MSSCIYLIFCLRAIFSYSFSFFFVYNSSLIWCSLCLSWSIIFTFFSTYLLRPSNSLILTLNWWSLESDYSWSCWLVLSNLLILDFNYIIFYSLDYNWISEFFLFLCNFYTLSFWSWINWVYSTNFLYNSLFSYFNFSICSSYCSIFSFFFVIFYWNLSLYFYRFLFYFFIFFICYSCCSIISLYLD